VTLFGNGFIEVKPQSTGSLIVTSESYETDAPT
jgi:hypothetical protein